MSNLEHVSVPLTKKSTVHLTPREVEVARFLAYGASNKQIAQKLDVSDFTYETMFHACSESSASTRALAWQSCCLRDLCSGKAFFQLS